MPEQLELLFVWWVRVNRNPMPQEIEKNCLVWGIDPYEQIEKWELILEESGTRTTTQVGDR